MRIASGEIPGIAQTAEDLLYAEARAFRTSIDFAKQNNLTSWLRAFDNYTDYELIEAIYGTAGYRAKAVSLNGNQLLTQQQLDAVLARMSPP